jgi:signal transduction histidine kinase
LIAALQRYAREQAPGAEDAADVELSLLQLQKFATLGQLVSGVAHDFGNLMTVVLGYSELMFTAVKNGEAADLEQLAELRRAAERASALTASLLGYARPAADDAAPLDLGLLVGGLTAMLGRLLGSTGTLVVTIAPTTAAVLADARQVEHVIVNLVLNARDAIAVGGRVEVAVEPVRLTDPLVHALGTAPPGEYVRLRVRDNGCGMARETVAQLFQPFLTTKGHGAGLGLTIVARIAGKANAAVVVDSAAGAGTTVEVLFPRLDPNAAGNER